MKKLILFFTTVFFLTACETEERIIIVQDDGGSGTIINDDSDPGGQTGQDDPRMSLIQGINVSYDPLTSELILPVQVEEIHEPEVSVSFYQNGQLIGSNYDNLSEIQNTGVWFRKIVGGSDHVFYRNELQSGQMIVVAYYLDQNEIWNEIGQLTVTIP